MTFDLRTLLPSLMPKAIAWAEAQAQFIAEHGVALTDAQCALAKRVGVRNPERVRIAEVSQLHPPVAPQLHAAAVATGLFSPGIVGMTFGYGIYVLQGHATPRLLSHEFRHVQQYEHAGAIAQFLPVYLGQIVDCGYRNAPYEMDARAHEI